ncbi:MAG: ABC transporter substrate-binding protein [Gammaproteobacteria bacterium]
MIGKLTRLFAMLCAASIGVAAQAEPQTIAIANFGPHPDLDATVSGFKAELARQGFRDGQEVKYAYTDGNFNPALLPQIITQMEATNPVLMLTVTTPVTQASKQILKNPKLPVVFAAVTDPVKAEIVPSWDKGGERHVGASDLQDVGAVMAFAKALLPKAAIIGVPFNAGEANDVATVQAIEAAAAKLGVTVRSVSVEAATDIPQRVQSLQGVDYVYVIASNLIMPALPAVASAADRLGIPVISASTDAVQQGIAAGALAVSYDSVGANAGKLAAEILKGKKPSELANSKPTAADHKKIISAKKMEQLKLPIPAALENCDCIVR